MSDKCERCDGSGEIAVCVYTLRYRGAGPVPDYARNVAAEKCFECHGTGKREEAGK